MTVTLLYLAAYQAGALLLLRADDRGPLATALVLSWFWPLLVIIRPVRWVAARFGVTLHHRAALRPHQLQADDRPGIWWEVRHGLFHHGFWYREYKGPVVGRWVGLTFPFGLGLTLVRTVDL